MPSPNTLDSLIRSTITELIESAPQPPTLPEIELGPALERTNRSGGRLPHRRLRLPILVAVVSVAAAVGTYLAVAAPSKTPGKQLHSKASSNASAHTVLLHDASLADAQPSLVPGPGQWLYVQSTSGSITDTGVKSGTWNYYIQGVIQQWTNPAGSNTSSAFYTGQPQFITEADLAGWEAAGSPPIEIGAGRSPPAVYYDVADLPTNPSQMADYFATQTQIFGASNPSPGYQFDTAAGFLIHGASSAQRAALFQYMAALPGVENLGTTQAIGSDKSGQTLAIAGTMGRQIEVVIDPSTTQLIEERVVVANPGQLGTGLYPVEMQAGEVISYTDLAYIGLANSSSSEPEGAPSVPSPWLPDTPRSPLSTVAYPGK